MQMPYRVRRFRVGTIHMQTVADGHAQVRSLMTRLRSDQHKRQLIATPSSHSRHRFSWTPHLQTASRGTKASVVWVREIYPKGIVLVGAPARRPPCGREQCTV